MLAGFHSDYPDIVIDLTIDDAVVDVVAGGFDAAIRPGEVIEKDMVAVRIGADHRQLAAASPAYLAAHGTPRDPADLHAHRCLRWRWSGRVNPYNWEFYRDANWLEVAVDGPLILNDRAAMLRAAIDGIGVGFFTSLELAGPVAAGKLVPLLEAWAHPYPGYAICYPRQRQMAPALRAFIDALRAFAGKS